VVTSKTDTRSYTFQQALPYIAKLADDPEFVEIVNQVYIIFINLKGTGRLNTLPQMKKEQDELERQLWEDRRAIHKKYEEKVKIAVTK